MLNHYFYDAQIRAYILQFCTIFAGLKVQTGKGECDEAQFIAVPCVVGSKDRVVAAIMSGNTQNRVFSLPIMGAQMSGMALAPERRKAPSYVDNRVTLPMGGVFPDDLTVVKRAMPVPYDLTMELSIYTSNTQQLHQILEQILVLFNPDIQIQKNDAAFDWTKISRVELTDIGSEENYPAGGTNRYIVWTLNFLVPIWLSIPMGVRDEVVQKLYVTLGIDESGLVQELDENGNPAPYIVPVGTFEMGSAVPKGPVSELPLQVSL